MPSMTVEELPDILEPQEIYNRAVRGVINQGRPAVNASDLQFIDSAGARCAIGHVVPRRILEQAFPNRNADGHEMTDIMPVLPEDVRVKLEPHYTLLDALRIAHDTAAQETGALVGGRRYNDDFVRSYKDKVKGIAKQFGLDDFYAKHNC